MCAKKSSMPKHTHLRVMTIESLIDLNEAIVLDHGNYAITDVPEMDMFGVVWRNLAANLYTPNIDAMDEQQQLHPGKITLEVLHVQYFHCPIIV